MSRILVAAALAASASFLAGVGAQAASFGSPSIRALNPQPLPPKAIGVSHLNRLVLSRIRPGGLASLNPQPLPPKAIFRVR